MHAMKSVFLLVLAYSYRIGGSDVPPLTCSLDPEEEGTLDPSLKEMKFDLGLGDGEETFLAYVQPNVTTFYKDSPPASMPVVPQHRGLAGMFINMSNRRLSLFW